MRKLLLLLPFLFLACSDERPEEELKPEPNVVFYTSGGAREVYVPKMQPFKVHQNYSNTHPDCASPIYPDCGYKKFYLPVGFYQVGIKSETSGIAYYDLRVHAGGCNTYDTKYANGWD